MTERSVFVGGQVWTPGLSASRRLDVLVVGNRIVKVTRPGELDLDDAVIVDLDGALMLPGFQDAHAHPGAGGNDLRQCNLLGLETSEQILSAIATYSSNHPALDWVLGGGWMQRAFEATPTRELLDGLVGGRKAVLHAHSRHAVWASSAALEAAGIDKNTPDPASGHIERDRDGNPSGVLHEDAMTLLNWVMPRPNIEGRKQSILAAQHELLQLGLTSVQDALVGTGLGMQDHHDADVALLGEDSLMLRITTALWWDPRRGTEQIAELQERRSALEEIAPEPRIISDTVKMMVDGSGMIFVDREALIDATVALDAAGFTVHYHSYGESSTTNVLDAVASAREANPASCGRHHIAHLMVVQESDFARFEPLGVTANIQGFWANRPVSHEMLRPSQCSLDPHRREYAFGRLLTSGARLAAGSDWPVSSANPLDAVSVASRRAIRGPGQQADDLDRLDVAAVLTAYTSGSAYVNGRACSTGRIAQGFLADLVVLDRDVLEPGVDAASARVHQTWIDGVQRFQR